MRVLPPPPNQSRRRGVRHVWRKQTHDGRRRPLSRCRRSSLGCPSVAACGEGSGSVRFVLASGGRAKGSGGDREQTADNAKCGLLVSHLLLVSPSHGPRFPARSPSPAPRLSPRPSSSSPLLVFVLVFVLFVDLVEPAPGPTPVTLGPTCYARCDPDRHLCCRLCYP